MLWRDASGNLVGVAENGGTVQPSGGLGNIPTTWSVAETSDLSGDGMNDILWRDYSGNTAVRFPSHWDSDEGWRIVVGHVSIIEEPTS
jgi:hypothetical protein